MPIGNRWKLATTLLLVGLLFSVLAMLGLAELHEDLTHPYIEQLDQQIMLDVHARDTSDLTRIALTLSWIGSPATLVPLLSCLTALLWYTGYRRSGVILLAAMTGAGALDTALKLYFRRVRPDVSWALAKEHSFSFPSGHSAGAVVLYGIVSFLVWNHLRALWQRIAVVTTALLLIAGIGASRVYIGVHYPTDVAAGYLVGLFWLFTVIGANEFADWYEARHPSTDHPSALDRILGSDSFDDSGF